jgi:hypothetical protein
MSYVCVRNARTCNVRPLHVTSNPPQLYVILVDNVHTCILLYDIRISFIHFSFLHSPFFHFSKFPNFLFPIFLFSYFPIFLFSNFPIFLFSYFHIFMLSIPYISCWMPQMWCAARSAGRAASRCWRWSCVCLISPSMRW